MSKLSEMVTLTKTQWLMLLVALVYVISPVDIIPELLTGPIGLTDDAAAMALIGTTALGGWKAAHAGKARKSGTPAATATA